MRSEGFCGFVKNYSLPAQRSGKISFESQPRIFAFAFPESSSSRRVCGIVVQERYAAIQHDTRKETAWVRTLRSNALLIVSARC